MAWSRQIQPLQTAKVNDLDEAKATPFATTKDGTLENIRKCFRRADDPKMDPAVVNAALTLAKKLLALHCVQYADLANEPEERKTLGGKSTVSIVRTNEDGGKVQNYTWEPLIAKAITIFFDCKVYNYRQLRSLDWTFYGIAANTVAAAMAFEMVHNLVPEWDKSVTGMETRYCYDIVHGLTDTAKREKAREEAQAKKQQEEDRIRNTTTLKKHGVIRWRYVAYKGDGRTEPQFCQDGGDAVSEDDPDLESEDKDEGTIWEEQIREIMEQQKQWREPDGKGTNSSDKDNMLTRAGREMNLTTGKELVVVRKSPWKSSEQLMLFRKNAAKVSDEFLVFTNVSLWADLGN